MKVLFLRTPSDVNYDLRLHYETDALLKAGYDVEVICHNKNNQKTNYKQHDYPEMTRLDRIVLNPFLLNKINEIKPDVIHAHNLNTLKEAIIYKYKTNCKVFYDCREYFEYMVSSKYHFLKYWFHEMEKELVQYVDGIFVTEPSMQRYFRRNYKIEGIPINVLYNTRPFYAQKKYNNDNKIVLSYLGSLSDKRYIKEIIETVEHLKNTTLFIGSSHAYSRYKKEVIDLCQIVNNTDYIGCLPKELVIPMIYNSDVVISLSNPADGNNGHGLANKVIEGMCCGVPSIVSKETYNAEIITKLGCGVSVDINELEDTLNYLKDNKSVLKRMGKNAVKAYHKHFSISKFNKRLLDMYGNI